MPPFSLDFFGPDFSKPSNFYWTIDTFNSRRNKNSQLMKLSSLEFGNNKEKSCLCVTWKLKFFFSHCPSGTTRNVDIDYISGPKTCSREIGNAILWSSWLNLYDITYMKYKSEIHKIKQVILHSMYLFTVCVFIMKSLM